MLHLSLYLSHTVRFSIARMRPKPFMVSLQNTQVLLLFLLLLVEMSESLFYALHFWALVDDGHLILFFVIDFLTTSLPLDLLIYIYISFIDFYFSLNYLDFHTYILLQITISLIYVQ